MITQPQNPSARVLLYSLKGSIIPAIWRKVLFTTLLSSLVVAGGGNPRQGGCTPLSSHATLFLI